MISGVVHTYNEAENVKRALESLSWVDELIVVDMGSTDKTLEVVSTFTDKIFHFPYTGFVEPARNFALTKAKGEWIFVLDADEQVPHALAVYLQEMTHQDKADYFQIPRRNIIFGEWIAHAGWWPDYQIRFFKKGCVTWPETIHAIPFTKGRGFDIEPKESLSVIHYHYQTIEQFVERLNRYTTIEAKEQFLTNQPFSAFTLFEKSGREFVSRFFARSGYKDGTHGLALSKLQAFSALIVQLKLWELQNFQKETISMEQIETELKTDFYEQYFWLTKEKLRHPHAKLQGILWKLKRKIVNWL